MFFLKTDKGLLRYYSFYSLHPYLIIKCCFVSAVEMEWLAFQESIALITLNPSWWRTTELGT